ncbi:carboxypeptidase-like regulatory domain-containing protein [Pyxidicoccus xibeiensis]|uniref:carboxypeptidase-like regulatory domain-containing protein n=1 Tax=Pyxidicoccus xibeiensis TaxID=2906759 RepID=UPI0020A7009A|nr:carboxypeptidase-like regulatory domain-containing protein [Pyxidicoccus xibeiensis]MCP3135906.1 carboxypeptidase-like regulatory domain-containing protein [Pyxidicoccus xibeiensis]
MRLPVAPWVLLLLPAVALGSQVEGTLLDVKGQALAGTTLEVVRAQDGEVTARPRSGPEGRFRVELPPGRYLLRIRHPERCAPSAADAELELRDDEDLAALSVLLRRCVRVTGRAFGLDGAPLARGKVTLRWRASLEPPRTASTDEAGRFVFERAPQGQVQVFLRDEAGEELLSQTRLSALRALEVRAHRVLRFLVRGPGGAPLPEVDFSLVPEPRDGVTLEAKTDARGLVGLPAHAQGRYRLLASWEQEDQFLRYVWKDVELKPEAMATPLELSFAERPSSAILSGRVRKSDHRPAVNAEVTALQLFPSFPLDDDFPRGTAYPRESATTRTDSEGRFTLRDLRPGEYRLSVTHPEGFGEVEALTDAPADVLLPALCPKSVSGRVVDASGLPVPRFRLMSQQVEDSEGRFRHEHLGCHFYVEANGFQPRWVSVPASPLGQVEVPDIALQPARDLVGRLLHPDGTPATARTLTATWRGETWHVDTKPTDAAGRFSVGPLPVDAEVVLEAPGKDHVARFRIPPGRQDALALRLPRLSARLDVRVHSTLEEFHVTAEGAQGTFSASGKRSDRVLLRVAPGRYDVWVSGTPDPKGARAGVPHRFAPQQVHVAAGGTATLAAHPTQGAGALRVVLARPSHYDDVYVFPGVHPWPDNLDAFGPRKGQLEADTPVDESRSVDDAPWISIIFYRAQSDFTGLAPGTYTVFATNSYGGDQGRTEVFRKVVEVDGSQRRVVLVRFHGEDSRLVR